MRFMQLWLQLGQQSGGCVGFLQFLLCETDYFFCCENRFQAVCRHSPSGLNWVVIYTTLLQLKHLPAEEDNASVSPHQGSPCPEKALDGLLGSLGTGVDGGRWDCSREQSQQLLVGSPEHLLLPCPSVGTHGGLVRSASKYGHG